MSPILLFAYNRPQHTERLLLSLAANAEARESELYVYLDAPRTPADAAPHAAVRSLLLEERWQKAFRALHLTERTTNHGLARNIIAGVTEQLAAHGRCIVLEDDLVLSPFFLRFMNEALDRYADDPRVCHIHACDFTRSPRLPDTFFLRFTGSWGWATWQRAWQLFEPDGAKLLRALEEQNLTREFDFQGAYPFTRMLRRQVQGLNNSWAIRWNASLFLAGRLSLNVGRSLVANEGFDGTGTHCENAAGLNRSTLWLEPLPVNPGPVEESADARAIWRHYYRRTNSLPARALRRLQALLPF